MVLLSKTNQTVDAYRLASIGFYPSRITTEELVYLAIDDTQIVAGYTILEGAEIELQASL